MENATRLIPLSQGKFAIVDAIDYDYLNQWKWTAAKRPTTDKCLWYAIRRTARPEHKMIYMHREIVKRAGLPQSHRYDHRDRDGLNNTRKNLRPCTQQQNCCNNSKRAGTSSRFKGVYRNNRFNRWEAQIHVKGKHIYLGRFADEQEAAMAYANAARHYFGEFACF